MSDGFLGIQSTENVANGTLSEVYSLTALSVEAMVWLFFVSGDFVKLFPDWLY